MTRAVAVVGAHLSGMPLNGELKNLGARLLEASETAPNYRLYALTNTKPHKPGLLRVPRRIGGAIDKEILVSATPNEEVPKLNMTLALKSDTCVMVKGY